MNETKIRKIDEQIKSGQQSISYDIKDFTIEYYVQKYLNGEEKDDNEIYVPEYQREFIWDIKRQSKFMESIILGLPIPLIFVAEIEETGRLEIVDGSQRIRTLAAFLNNELRLSRLEKLTEINDLIYNDFSSARQRFIKNTSMRMIVLSSRATEEVRNDMFERINTSSVPLLPMETRRGIYRGKFMDFVTKLAEDKKFKELCPIDRHFIGRREEEELVLRFFAFSAGYPYFNLNGINLEYGGVAKYIDKYLVYKNDNCTDDELKEKEKEFYQMLEFVGKTFINRGFAKHKKSTGTSRAYFEALSIGTSLALKSRKQLHTTNLNWSFVSKSNPNDLTHLLSGRYHTHKPKALESRINYVYKKLTNS
jgi:hypothetical protein